MSRRSLEEIMQSRILRDVRVGRVVNLRPENPVPASLSASTPAGSRNSPNLSSSAEWYPFISNSFNPVQPSSSCEFSFVLSRMLAWDEERPEGEERRGLIAQAKSYGRMAVETPLIVGSLFSTSLCSLGASHETDKSSRDSI